MSDERIDVVVEDKVSPGISKKIKAIGDAAISADTAVARLKQNLANLNANALQNLQRVLQTATQTINQNALAQQQLLTLQQRTVSAAAQAAAAQIRVNTAATQGAAAQQRLAAATAQAQAAQSRAATAALQLQAAQQAANRPAGPGLGSMVRGAAAAVGVGLSASSIIESADAYSVLQNKLNIVADSQRQVNELTAQLFDIANRTYAPVQATAQSFARFDAALVGLGKSQNDTLRMQETINKLFTLGGATAQEQAGALIQLSQAFTSNVLQGEEFRSISENMPKQVRTAIAEVLKINESGLKKAASEGKITGEVLYQSFKRLEGFADGKFAKFAPTMGQAFQVLRNTATQFFGQLDKALGVTNALAQFILFLSNHMKALGIGLAVVGAALAVAFGPALIGMLAAATKAVLAFSVALLANPIGLLVVGITAATAAIALYGDQVTLTADKNVTLKDTALATLSLIKDGFGVAASFVRDHWNSAIDFINSKTDGFGEKFRDIGVLLGQYVTTVANGIIATFVGSYNAIVNGYRLLPAAMKDIFVLALNGIVDITEKIVNATLAGVNKITSLANQGSEKLGLGKIFDSDLSASLADYKMEVSGAASDLAGTVKQAFSSAFDTDYVGDATNAVMRRAKEISNARLKAAAGGSTLRGTGTPTVKPEADEKAAKAAMRRALALSQVNAELDKEIRSLTLVGPERELQSKMDAIDIALAGKKIKLSQDERKAIQDKVTALIQGKDAQQALDRVYEEATGPLREYQATQQAAMQLLGEGKINAEAFGRAMNVAGLQYEDAVDPLARIRREITDQTAVLGSHGEAREVAINLQRIENELRGRGLKLSQDERAELEKSLATAVRKNAVDAEYARIYSSTTGAQQGLRDAVTATNKAYDDGLLNLDAYKLKLSDLGKDALAMKLQAQTATFDESMLAGIGRLTDGYKGVADGLAQSFGETFQTIGDGFADATAHAIVFGGSFKEALGDVARQAVSGLISSLIKLGIQYAVNAAVGQSLAAAATAGSVAQAGIVSAAWATPAALASLATLGTNSVPAAAALAGTVAVSQALSVAGMAGFEEGGYTGNVGRKTVAGVVHGQEFVMNAEATKRNRPMLEAMNNGATPKAAPAPAAAPAASEGGGTRIINLLDPGLLEDYVNSPSGERVVMNLLRRNGITRD